MENLNMGSSKTLSKRSELVSVDLDYVNNYSSWPAVQNSYHETENPEGIVNFGTAVSGLMDDVWLERLNSQTIYKPSYKHCRYYQFWGHDQFRKKLAEFMTCFFKPKEPIVYENLFVLNGALVLVDVLGFFLADEKDVFLCPVPAYGSYFQAAKQRCNIEIVSVPFEYKIREKEATFGFKMETLEKIAMEQRARGKNVRAFILNNPNNPLGMVLERQTVEKIMRFCQRERIHLIADEMYCMSVFNEQTIFDSVLAIQNDGILDPDLLHVIWGFSKDLCLTGFRTGVLHTKNTELQLKIQTRAQFHAVPLPLMDMLHEIVNDIDWFQKYFVPTNMERLRSQHEVASRTLKSWGIPITTTTAGFFFLAYFGSFLKPCNEATCKAFIRKLYENRVYLTPSWEMGLEPGWFRVCFTPYMEKGLLEGLKRLRKTLDQWKEDTPEKAQHAIS